MNAYIAKQNKSICITMYDTQKCNQTLTQFTRTQNFKNETRILLYTDVTLYWPLKAAWSGLANMYAKVIRVD